MSTDAPVVQVAAGALRGRRPDRHGVTAFLGVPYAAPPFGPARFAPPRPAPAWEGVRDATRFGATVPKTRLSPHLEQMWPERWIEGEDCLNLNVWTPALDGSAPVLVWVHGGGFTNGSGSARELDGTAFARDGVVCVTLNYRVGADGFLFLDDGVANAGTLDQQAALAWVHEEIAAFGGDPARVTLAGHSAGGSSVLTQLVSPLSTGLYTRAASASTSGIHRLTSAEHALRVGRDLAARLGVTATREAMAAVPTPALLAAVDQQGREMALWGGDADVMAPWAPTADGHVLPEDPEGAIAAGRAREVPLLTGTARDELRLHLSPEGVEAVDEDGLSAAAAALGLGPAEVEVYRSHRPGASAGDLLVAVESDWWFRMPTIRLAEARAQGGTAQTWLYRFDRPRPQDNAGYGAAHAVDVPFVFDTIDVGETHARIGPRPSQQVADLVHGLWTAFAQGRDPRWPVYDTATRTTALITEGIDVVDDPDGADRAAWAAFHPHPPLARRRGSDPTRPDLT